MRLARIVVESFQAIQHADIELGPGLNVLHGPNDLGKSTLASAIRAALLLPPSSSEAEAYVPWYADATPRVALTFVDGDNRYWKVSKSFGTNGSAELHHSKDGLSYSLDSKGRVVEEKIRTLLAWGIPAPGGKGAPRGLPTSFIASALLAAQTDVDSILERTLDADADGSGRLRLTKALATLAQDPLFKKVLDAAQREVDACFTATGQPRRGKSSRFTEATNTVKRLREELLEIERRIAESTSVEESVVLLREQAVRAQGEVDEATSALGEATTAHDRALARAAAQAELDVARRALAEIDAKVAYVEALATDAKGLEAELDAKRKDLERAEAAKAAAEGGVRAADEAHRAATSADGARELELRRAQLAESASKLAGLRKDASTRLERATRAAEASAAAERARVNVVAARKVADTRKTELTESSGRAAEAKATLAGAKALVSYVRWHAAAAARDAVERFRADAAGLRTAAEAKDRGAAEAASRSVAAMEALEKRATVLPTNEQAKNIAALERKVALAEAELGGGLTVVMRPRRAVEVRVLADGTQVIAEAALSSESKIDAKRAVEVLVGDMIDIEVTAGTADRRHALEELRARWRAEAAPVLELAGIATVEALQSALQQLGTDRAAAADIAAAAQRERDEAANMRAQASALDERADHSASAAADIEERRAAIGEVDLAPLAASFAKLGAAKDLEAEKAQRVCERALIEHEEARAKADRESGVAAYQLSDAETRVVEAEARAQEASAGLEGADASTVRAAAESELERLAREEAEVSSVLNGLEAEATREVEAAAKLLALAKSQAEAAARAAVEAKSSVDTAHGRLEAHRGKCEEARRTLDALDRTGAASAVAVREAALAALPEAPPQTEDLLAAAERRVDAARRALTEAKEELLQKEGALRHVGGNILRDESDRTREALLGAEARERSVETDAAAWKLLHATLRAVENEEGAHLGRALAGPVSARFTELTGGRYGALQLGTDLRAQSLEVTSISGTPDVLARLSVGSRNQLATLVRLSIAEQLKSAIVLDDQLVHTDGVRHAWFRDLLLRAALNVQVVVLTCRPADYVSRDELDTDSAVRDIAGGSVRLIDASRVVKRWSSSSSLQRPRE